MVQGWVLRKETVPPCRRGLRNTAQERPPWQTVSYNNLCTQAAQKLQTDMLLDKYQGVRLAEHAFPGHQLPAGARPAFMGAHLKHSYPERMAQEVAGRNQHLSVASAEVNARQLVQLGVYPVQAPVQQILRRTKGRGEEEQAMEPGTSAVSGPPPCPHFQDSE